MEERRIEMMAVKENLDVKLTELLTSLDKLSQQTEFMDFLEQVLGAKTKLSIRFLTEKEQAAVDQSELPQLIVDGKVVLQGKSFTIEQIAGVLGVGISLQIRPD